jgi:cell wall assembly regulator SMI1
VFTTLLSAWRTRLHSPGNSAGQNHTAAIGSKEWNISGKTFWKFAGTSPWFPKVNDQLGNDFRIGLTPSHSES